MAIQSLRNKESNLAIVGGINLILSPKRSVSFTNAGMLSVDGRCKVFDESANGYVRGEGCGVIILQSLKNAVCCALFVFMWHLFFVIYCIF